MFFIIVIFLSKFKSIASIERIYIKFKYIEIGIHKKKNIHEEDCSICLNKMNNKIIKLNNCIHCFHSDCIIKWFKQGNISCPICRESLLKLN